MSVKKVNESDLHFWLDLSVKASNYLEEMTKLSDSAVNKCNDSNKLDTFIMNDCVKNVKAINELIINKITACIEEK